MYVIRSKEEEEEEEVDRLEDESEEEEVDRLEDESEEAEEEESEEENGTEADVGREVRLAASKKRKRASDVEAPIKNKKAKKVDEPKKRVGGGTEGSKSNWTTIEMEDVDEAKAGDAEDEEEAGPSNSEATPPHAKKVKSTMTMVACFINPLLLRVLGSGISRRYVAPATMPLPHPLSSFAHVPSLSLLTLPPFSAHIPADPPSVTPSLPLKPLAAGPLLYHTRTQKSPRVPNKYLLHVPIR
ncbi:hypothetical protein NLJ89_g10203 [Agrocybe chaxingu]|uniref:Uncharacterized protein n=1 Tax=Agrocybe chaxingu TaxID=84603 RepID=A0A9W8JS51_9AGAR|nr:hypothetical protein NLJ89_g10203 [Agrocybe chaxingu]